MYQVTKGNWVVQSFQTENEAWRCLLDIQGKSVHRAVLEDGYDIIYPNGVTLSSSYERENA